MESFIMRQLEELAEGAHLEANTDQYHMRREATEAKYAGVSQQVRRDPPNLTKR
jgi:hypothetical protein